MSVNTTALQALYVAYFNRPADPTGLAYWEDALANGGATLADVAAAFATTNEYKSTFAGMDNNHIVAQIYVNLFGRQPEPEGLNFWSQALTKGDVTIDYAVTQIASGAQGSDAVAYQAKAQAAVSFTQALDTTPEILAYSGDALALGKTFIASVTDAATLAAATAPAALDATIQQVIVTGDPLAAAVLNAKNAYDTAAADAATALATAQTKAAAATTAADAVTAALTAQAAAKTTADATDAAALTTAATDAQTAADAAAQAKLDADAAVVADQQTLKDAIASGDANAVSTANGQLLIDQSKAADAATAATAAATAAADAKAAMDAAVAADADYVTATANVSTAVTNASTAAADAVTAAAASTAAAATASTDADAYVAAAKLTAGNTDDVAAAAAKAAAATAAASAATAAASAASAKSVVDAVLNEAAGQAEVVTTKAAYDAAVATANTDAAAMTTAATDADAAIAGSTSLALANAAITAAAAESTAATTAKASADAAVTAAAAYVAAAAKTASTTDDADAAAAKTAADALVTAAAAGITAAAADVTAAAALPDQFVAKTKDLTTGIDTFTGGKGDDTVTASGAGKLSAFDNIDGGAGAGDTLNVTTDGTLDTTGIGALKIANMENVSISTLGAVTVDSTGWGTTTLTVTQASSTVAGSDVDVQGADATTDVIASNAFATGDVAITGGKNQTVTAITSDVTLNDAAGAIISSVSKTTTHDTKINGGTSVTVNNTGVTTGKIEVGQTAGSEPTGAVTVTSTGDYTDGANTAMGWIKVNGGSSVTVNETAGITSAEESAAVSDASNFTVTQSAVTVTGTSATTTVTVTQSAAQDEVDATDDDGVIGIANGDVTINDVNAGSTTKAGKIATVSLTNFGAATVNSNALATVNLGGTGTSFTATQSLTTPTVTTLNMNLKGLETTGAVTVDSDYTTLKIDSSTTASTLNSLTATGATAVTISGDKLFTATAQTLTAATQVTVTNSAGATLGSMLGVNTAFTGGSGVETIIVGATKKAIATGAGNDKVTLSVDFASGGSVNAGDGTGDILDVTSANAATLSGTAGFEDKISGFEVLNLGATGAANAVDVSGLDDISTVISAGVTAGGLTLSGLAATNSVTFTAKVDAASSIALASSSGTSDTVNLTLKAAAGFSSGAALTINGVENINVTTSDTSGTATAFAQSISADKVKAVVVSGNAGIDLTGLTATTLTSLDASGVTATGANGAVTLTTGALAAAASLTGGAGDDYLNAAAATKAVTMNGGSGADVLVGGAAADTLTGGAGADVFAVFTATNSNGVNQDTITDFVSGTDHIGTGTAVTYAGEANGYGAVLTSLTGTAYQAVLDTSTNTLYIDVDGINGLTSADMSIKLNGVTDLSQADFALVGDNGANALTGNASANVIVGLGGADTIDGGAGADTITTGAGADNVVLTTGLTADTIVDFTTGAAGDKIQLDISSLEGAGAVEAGKTISLDDLVDGTTAIGASAATIQEVADQAGGAAVAAAGAATVYVLLGETYADLAALETGLETGDHELTAHANSAVDDGFIVVWSDGTDSHVSMVRIAVDSGADFAAGDLVATDLATLVGTGTLTTGEINAANFAFIA